MTGDGVNDAPALKVSNSVDLHPLNTSFVAAVVPDRTLRVVFVAVFIVASCQVCWEVSVARYIGSSRGEAGFWK